MQTWSFYDPATGELHARRLICTRAQLDANTPPGMVPILGAFDARSQRVDVSGAEPVVVPWQPPPPPLAQLKRDAHQRMARAWDEARAAGVAVGGKVAPTDASAWTRYLAIRQMAGEAGWVDVPIPLADGTFELLTQAKAQALWSALKDMERALLARLRDRVQAIQAAATAAEVAAVEW